MPPRLRIPKSPDERRAMKAARQARWRENAAKKAAVTAQIDHSMGLTNHPPPPLPAIPSQDLAKMMRDRFHAIIDGMSDVDLMDKDFAPSLTLALKTQKVLDDREKVKAKTGNPEFGRLLIALVEGTLPPKQIDSGMVIEGEARVVDELETA